MKIKQYSIFQISARTILNCARKTENGYRFYFDVNDETNQPAIQKTMQDDCAMFHQLLPLTDVPGEPALPEEDKLLSFLVLNLYRQCLVTRLQNLITCTQIILLKSAMMFL